ncbi:MAG: ATP-binding protein [Saprospiraceae bacterium]|jgi:serine/threonine-protein kinase RsbW|nr:ATP-binding protein [Saprospiraceae bacterium]MBK7795445.1 ATP-binding protein [Saprospiraceae bacterium]MBL0260556.1 ATP-binding protein [Saprospiraceae bacterium]MBX7163918.1 ATP-binding protein [Saprospiraceae bacterium]
MIRIASLPANICLIEGYLDRIFDEYHLDKRIYPNVLVTLTEAVNNAIIHGNKSDENKFVNLKTVYGPQFITFRVSDEGSGFDPQAIPDPTLPENLDRCGGRGVFLMQKLSDQLVFSNDGRTVEICFTINS